MSYPEDNTAPIVEWLIDGVWTDLTAQDRIRTDVEITARGRQNEQGQASPTSCTYTVDNRDYAINNRRPGSTYYGLIPNGIQTRVRAGTGDNHVYMRYSTATVDPPLTAVVTADKAALDIVGDLEVRADVWPWSWRPAARNVLLVTKYGTTGNQRSWALYLNMLGRLIFVWSTDGTAANRVFATSTAAVPATSGRLSVKATIDVNNGAGGNTVAFYTASSISGTYTQLGASVVTAGVTSIFSSTADLVAGAGSDTQEIFSNGMGFGGRFYGLHLYNSAGTRVANPDFTTWDLDDTSNPDSHANTWTATGQARVTSPRLRFWGQLTSSEQVSDTTGRDVVVPVQSADLLQVLGAAKVPVESPLTLNIRPRSGLLGWWPHEDGSSASRAATGLPVGKAGIATAVTFGQASTLNGAARVAELTTQQSKMTYHSLLGTNTGEWTAVWLFKMPATLPASEAVFATFTTSGRTRTITVETSATTFGINMYSADTGLLDSAGVTHGTGVVVAGNWIAMRLKMAQSGAFTAWELAWYQQGSDVFWGTSGSYLGVSGEVNMAYLSANAATEFAGMQLSHFIVSEEDVGFSTNDLTWSNAINAYDGETAVARVARVTDTAGIYCEVVGEAASSMRLGPQPIDTPLNVLRDAEKADGGWLTGLRDAYGLQYRTRQDAERHRDADLDYDLHLSAVPRVLSDGLLLVNDVTVTRRLGSSARAEITDGPNSTAEPPDGVGPRPSDGGGDLNVYADSLLPDIANLRARYGSFDQDRIPNLAVELHRPDTIPTTTAGLSVAYVDVGGSVRVSGWPAHLASDPILFLVHGYTETLGRLLWKWKANTTPAGPYQTGLYDVADQAGGKTRYGSAGSTLNAGITTTATTIVVAGTARVTTVEVWTTVSARYPLDVMIGGEQITLTQAPTGSVSPQTFNNVTRSVNGVIAEHDAGAPVRLYSPTYYGM